jgi:hypothetical protein
MKCNTMLFLLSLSPVSAEGSMQAHILLPRQLLDTGRAIRKLVVTRTSNPFVFASRGRMYSSKISPLTARIAV